MNGLVIAVLMLVGVFAGYILAGMILLVILKLLERLGIRDEFDTSPDEALKIGPLLVLVIVVNIVIWAWATYKRFIKWLSKY